MQSEHSYNPDVLTCLANLSSDEIFTPPELVNKILDILPPELWSNRNARFLDPMTKSGVFLREIAKRLMKGLEKQIPDQEERINHVFKNQIFGIAITELTALLARRSVYCSKTANGKYSVCDNFTDEQGNIRFSRIEHTWVNGKCKFCGASEENYERGTDLETHAYEFIHTEKPEELFNMKFDVIIGNPPYQLDTGGAGRQAKPIYNLFIEQAKKMDPKFLVMIIPSRWFAGGMGLDDFRDAMMNDNHITNIVDYTNAKECFPQNSISGGVCYFLRERDRKAVCNFVNISNGVVTKSSRPLNEFPVIVRYNDAVSIIRKVLSQNEISITTIISPLMPFGMSTNYRGKREISKENYITLHASNGVSYIKKDEVTNGLNILDKYKVMISKTSAEHAGEPGKDGKFRVLTSSIKVLKPLEVCTHSYFVIGSYEEEKQAINLLSYLRTKFVRFLILQSMSSINLSKLVFSFVPIQDFNHDWNDDMLIMKYNLNENEVKFIETMIRPMGEENE